MRRFILTLSGIALVFGCFVGTGNAANLTDKSIGISMELDDRLVKQPDWRGYRVFRSPDNSAALFIKPVHELSMYHLREDLKGEGGGFDDVDSIDLVVTNEAKNASVAQGSGIIVPVKGRIDEHKVKGVFGGFAGFSEQNFYIIAAARPDYWDDWMPSFQSMLESIQFINIDYSDMINGWYDRLIGKSLVPNIPGSQGKPAAEAMINLCDKGKVAFEKSAEPQPATPQQQTIWNGLAWVTVPVMPMPRPPASWLIEPVRGEPTLLIREGPSAHQFRLETDGKQISLNGKPYRVTENRLCKAEPRGPKPR